MSNLAGETYSFESSKVTNLDHPNGLSAFALLYQYEQITGVPKNHLRIISVQVNADYNKTFDPADYNKTFDPEDPNAIVDINYKVLLPFNPSINEIHVLVVNSDTYAKDLDLNLNNADLRSATLHKAKLREVNLKEARLDYAKLYEVDLSQAILVDANLTGAFISQAKLKNANFKNVCLRDALII